MCQPTALPAAENPAVPASPQGSRRRRIWELGEHAHCPIVGVCLPMPQLRRLVNKVVGGEALADDYALHCGVVASTLTRTPLAEQVNKELDRRYRIQLLQTARIKDTGALQAWWQTMSRSQDLAGAFWATLSSGRCTPELEHQVLGEVHMLQHQVGMASRADLAQMASLLDENAVLARELASAQKRSTQLTQKQAQQVQALEAALMRVRGDLIRSETDKARLQEQLAHIEAATPDLRTRFELTRTSHIQAERLATLQRDLLQSQQDSERQQRQLEAAREEIAHLHKVLAATPDTPDAPPAHDAAALQNRTVLCVGGRTAVVPLYRKLIEHTGGRFLHHDGGEQDSTSRLDTTLAAADLVICQTGCISHDAYWRVKDHCKRTGKRCVFVDTPSKGALERALMNALD